VKECRLRGVRGVIDRRTEKTDPNWKPTRRKWQRGDFEFENFQVYDLFLTHYFSDPTFRPTTLSIFSLQSRLLRKQWFLYDLFRANSIVGIFDGCLFNYGPPQHQKIVRDGEKKEMRLKLDGLNMDLLSTNASGPMGWIKEGTLDIDMNLFVPLEVPESSENYYPYSLEDPQEEVNDKKIS